MTQPDKSREEFETIVSDMGYGCGKEDGQYIRNDVALAWDVWSARDNQPAAVDAEKNFTTGDDDLDVLLDLSGDMVSGNANQDTGMYWLDVLERVKTRLSPAKPSDDSRRGDVDEITMDRMLEAYRLLELRLRNKFSVEMLQEFRKALNASALAPIKSTPDAGKAGEAVAWIRGSGLEMLKSGDGTACVYRSEGMSNHSIPLYTAPPPSAADALSLGEFTDVLYKAFENFPATTRQRLSHNDLRNIAREFHAALAANAPSADVLKDAERYRFLKSGEYNMKVWDELSETSGNSWDDIIDDAEEAGA